MGMVFRTFLIALVFAIIIFALGANNLFTIKDDSADFSLDTNEISADLPENLNRDAFLAIYRCTLVIHLMHLFLVQPLLRMMHTDMQKVALLSIL